MKKYIETTDNSISYNRISILKYKLSNLKDYLANKLEKAAHFVENIFNNNDLVVSYHKDADTAEILKSDAWHNANEGFYADKGGFNEVINARLNDKSESSSVEMIEMATFSDSGKGDYAKIISGIRIHELSGQELEVLHNLRQSLGNTEHHDDIIN